MTETLVFTLCKLELRGKEIALQSRSRCTRFSRGQQWTKLKESNVLSQTQNKLRSKCFAVFESGSLVTLLSSAFFTPIFSFWLLIHIEMKH